MSEFQRILEEIIDRKSVSVIVATVDAVDSNELTFDCTPLAGGAPIQDVRIRPVADQSDLGVVAVPAVGALVILLALNAASFVMHSASEWQRLEFRSDRCEMVMNADGNVTMKAESVLIESPSITLGASQGAEPYVKGNAMGSRVSEIYSHIRGMQQALMVMSASGVLASVGPLLALAPVFTALGTAIGIELPTTAADEAKYPLVKSTKIKGA